MVTGIAYTCIIVVIAITHVCMYTVNGSKTHLNTNKGPMNRELNMASIHSKNKSDTLFPYPEKEPYYHVFLNDEERVSIVFSRGISE